ncbi:hypothetical protein AAFN60_04025 [Roseibacillus persicicus]|uniref:hypothetical protein n=1 Tax=Roseibacillus persicicus TaxID=454148 RepID=UPI00398B93EF
MLEFILNLFGLSSREKPHLKEALASEPSPESFVGVYLLDTSKGTPANELGYASISSEIEIQPDGSFQARDVPASAMLGLDERLREVVLEPNTYHLHGKWELGEQLSSASLILTIDGASHSSGPRNPDVKLESEMPGVIPFNHALVFRNTEPLTLGFALMMSAEFETPAFLIYKPKPL